MKRFVSIWFPNLKTDWFSVRQPLLREVPFVLVVPDHGRKLISAANEQAVQRSICTGLVAADAKAIYPYLQVMDDEPGLAQRLLKRMAEWCIRFSPCVAVDGEDGLIIDASGCTHLWKDDKFYIEDIITRFKKYGFTTRVAIADTIGTAWAVARFCKDKFIVEPGQHANALLSLPTAALRLDEDTVERLNKLGLRHVKDFISIPKAALRRRFLKHQDTKAQRNTKSSKFPLGRLGVRINQALGLEDEIIQPVFPIEQYQERLPCLEPIATVTGIEIALKHLLEILCKRLKQAGKGIRTACLKCYRIDGRVEEISIGTIRASYHAEHLFRLFDLKIASIEPALGIELFILHATKVEDHSPIQEKMWKSDLGIMDKRISELLDRVSCKIGINAIRRYLPDEHYWPERSVKNVLSLDEIKTTEWRADKPRPLQLLSRPEFIEVTAPVPDYPPMNFRYKGKLHTIKKADGPERIEQEWWIEEGKHRDYYCVEDENGCRYWVFRSGHYTDNKVPQWFIHGFFA